MYTPILSTVIVHALEIPLKLHDVSFQCHHFNDRVAQKQVASLQLKQSLPLRGNLGITMVLAILSACLTDYVLIW